ncbi:MAG: 16S rRNA (cytosine(1402)-N(4))-methyltransferase RsmH [Geminicoccaceae bacterium]|nr:16S rRNA (cytosine(1402)-N(4))-methyltransferase RsmH [Geminicoccaceae bacterium]
MAGGRRDQAKPAGHVPVMIEEMLEMMAVRPGGTYVDATYGAGHYSAALLGAGAGQVFAIDRDPQAVERARASAAQDRRLFPLEGRFGEMTAAIEGLEVGAVDGIVFDLGVSSMQLDEPARGFSIVGDGPLDMRMGPTGRSAADFLNEASERELADVLRRFGEEPSARRIARAIVGARQAGRLSRTQQLAALVAGAARGPARPGHHPATRTFQAIRIAVNDELGELQRGLAAAERLLAPGGRLVVVAFHSLEDRIVKRFIAERSGRRGGSRHAPEPSPAAPVFRPLTRGVLRPGPDEVARNSRARSARLRAAERRAGGGGP